VPEIANFVADVKKKGGNWVIPLVVYDLPNRDCAAYASNGEYQVSDSNHVQQYQAYINAIKGQIQKAGNNTKFVLIYGPSRAATGAPTDCPQSPTALPTSSQTW
jgi:cellulose 1,4-beta-cellobiosidase